MTIRVKSLVGDYQGLIFTRRLSGIILYKENINFEVFSFFFMFVSRRFFTSTRPLLSKIYVGNFTWETQEDQLRDAFSRFGTITDCIIIRDRATGFFTNTGRPKGFGFVEFENENGASDAIKEMNQTMMGGRTINVREAIEKKREQ